MLASITVFPFSALKALILHFHLVSSVHKKQHTLCWKGARKVVISIDKVFVLLIMYFLLSLGQVLSILV